MDRPLFVHGPLRDPDLLAAVLGRNVPPARQALARAPGFAALSLAEGRRAALIRRPGEAVEGLVLLGLSAFEIDLLDTFESEHSVRAIVAVMIEEELHEADAYLLLVAISRLAAGTWSQFHWQQSHKTVALDAARAAIPDLRARLIAIRPH